MTSAADFRRIARSLEGTSEAPHLDRQAFKVARIYATLAADGRTANLKFAPDEQEMKRLLAPEAFAAVPNAWGQQGWTTITLSKVTAVRAWTRARNRVASRFAKKTLAEKAFNTTQIVSVHATEILPRALNARR